MKPMTALQAVLIIAAKRYNEAMLDPLPADSGDIARMMVILDAKVSGGIKGFYRKEVGIATVNRLNELLWTSRLENDAWWFGCAIHEIPADMLTEAKRLAAKNRNVEMAVEAIYELIEGWESSFALSLFSGLIILWGTLGGPEKVAADVLASLFVGNVEKYGKHLSRDTALIAARKVSVFMRSKLKINL